MTSTQSLGAVATARTFMFVPGNRHDRFEKALHARADLVVFDLEDAVPPDQKVAARREVARVTRGAAGPVVIRVNGPDTPWHADDAAIAIDSRAHIMIPKVESPSGVTRLGIPPGASTTVIALIETAVGVLEAMSIARTVPVMRLAFGSLDFAASLGIDPDDRAALAHARSHLVLASSAAGLSGPVDGVTQAVHDSDALVADVRHAKALGFTGKLCIHPSQCGTAGEVLTPTADEIAWAERVLDAVAGDANRSGVTVSDGKLVDAPVVKRAQAIVGVRS